jgi:predicted ester cyclase
MGLEENKALVRRWLKSIEQGLPDVKLLAPDIQNHNIPPGMSGGREGTRAIYEAFHKAFSDWHVNVHDIIAEGDKVAVRGSSSMKHTGEFQGIQGTGKEVTTLFMQVWTVREGKLAEAWEQYDSLSFMQQLGAVQSPRMED